jgi:Sulfatase-modifying factor enzyme 1
MNWSSAVVTAVLVVGGSCSSRTVEQTGGSALGGSGSNIKPTIVRPAESMTIIPAGTYAASDPVFAPDNTGACPKETLAKVEVFAKLAPWPDRPQHAVSFNIDKDVVSCRDYRACMKSGACSPIDLRGRCTTYPGVSATLDQAIAFCKWRGARLPTLLEWQAAVRGPAGKQFGKCDDESSDTCVSTAESGVRVELDTSEFTSTWACRTSHDSAIVLHPVLASSYGHALAGFVPRESLDDRQDTSLFRCARDQPATKDP